MNGFIITPVSPHALTTRPLVVNDAVELMVSTRHAREEVHLTVDGQIHQLLDREDRVICTKSIHYIKLYRVRELRYFDALRSKLKWGER